MVYEKVTMSTFIIDISHWSHWKIKSFPREQKCGLSFLTLVQYIQLGNSVPFASGNFPMKNSSKIYNISSLISVSSINTAVPNTSRSILLAKLPVTQFYLRVVHERTDMCVCVPINRFLRVLCDPWLFPCSENRSWPISYQAFVEPDAWSITHDKYPNRVYNKILDRDWFFPRLFVT